MEPRMVLWGVLHWPLCLPGMVPSLNQEDESPRWLSRRSRVPHGVKSPCWKYPTVPDTSRHLLSRFRMAPTYHFSYRTHIFLSLCSLWWTQNCSKNHEARKLENTFFCGLMEILCAVWWLPACSHIKRSFLYVFGSRPLRKAILFCLCFLCDGFTCHDKGFCQRQSPSESLTCLLEQPIGQDTVRKLWEGDAMLPLVELPWDLRVCNWPLWTCFCEVCKDVLLLRPN